jgi:hypothetical protein
MEIKTASEAIDVLGGVKSVAALFGVDTRVVWNWRLPDRGDRFPPTVALETARLLSERGYTFPLALFQQRAIVNRRRVRPPKAPKSAFRRPS